MPATAGSRESIWTTHPGELYHVESTRASGGIGRRAGFRTQWAISPWRFESSLAHGNLEVSVAWRILRILVAKTLWRV